ncbi:MAG: AI-2E family transporter [Anaerolineae bacterium]|nr:AI-2E family transporter [Anaerolineae bacterium]
MDERGTSQASSKLLRALIIALLIAAVIFIGGQIFQVARRFLDILLLFAGAWLVAFLLTPIINYLNRHPIPSVVVAFAARHSRPQLASRLDRFRLPHTLAVVLVYLGVLLGLAVLLLVAVPTLVTQLVDLGRAAPRLIEAVPDLLVRLQAELAARGVEVDINQLYEPNQLVQRAEAFGAQIVQQAFAWAAGLASILVSVLLVLTLSLYMNLDGPRLARQLHAVIPDHYHGQINLLGQSISRTFGGFMRGQLLIALLYGLPATIVMAFAGIGLAIVIGALSGFLMLIPLIGAPIAMVLPALTALVQAPQSALWLLIVMTVYQQILLQVLAPRVMADVLGMPALLVLMAIMVSMRLVGFWGLVFGIPLAGVIYALSVTYLEQSKIRRESLPRSSEGAATEGTFYLPAMGPGCLLVPTLGPPSDGLHTVGRYLASRGITSLGVDPYRPEPEGSWENWYSSVLLALDRLWRDCNQVFIVGQGLGAVLALHAASELPVAGVAALSLPLTRDGRYAESGATTAGLSSAVLLAHPTRLRPDRTQSETARLQERTHRELASVTCPVLLVHTEKPEMASPEDMRYVLERLGTTHKRIEWMESLETTRDWEAAGQQAFAFFRHYFQ